MEYISIIYLLKDTYDENLYDLLLNNINNYTVNNKTEISTEIFYNEKKYKKIDNTIKILVDTIINEKSISKNEINNIIKIDTRKLNLEGHNKNINFIDIFNNIDIDDFNLISIKRKKINPINFPSSNKYSSEFIIKSIIYKINNTLFIYFNKKINISNNDNIIYEVFIYIKNINQSSEETFQNFQKNGKPS